MKKYFSVRRPITPGTIPNSPKVKNIVNFDERKYCPSIGREAWGYIEYDGVLSNYSDYDLVEEVPKFRRELEPGDCILLYGDLVVIQEIFSQDVYNNEYNMEKSYVHCEFRDTDGNYRSWKSDIDGGKVVYFDEGNCFDVLSQELKSCILECKSILNNLGADTTNHLVYFKITKGRLCKLYSDYMDMGYVDLDAPEDSDEAFREMLKMVLEEQPNIKFLAFPSNLSGGRCLVLNSFPNRYRSYMTYIRVCALKDLDTKFKASGNVQASDISLIKGIWIRKHGVILDVLSELNSTTNRLWFIQQSANGTTLIKPKDEDVIYKILP